MHNFLRTLTLSSFLIVWGCNSDSRYVEVNPALANVVPTYTVNPDKATEQDLTQLTSETTFTHLQLPNEMYLREIRKVILNESSIYLFDLSVNGDRPKIYSFNDSGEFNFVIDRPGNGPGEFNLINDFDVTDTSVVLSTQSELMYFDKHSGEHIQTVNKPGDLFIQMIAMLDDKTVVTDASRTLHNLNKNLIKIYQLDQETPVYEAVPFDFHALKAGHSFRYLFYVNDTLSVVPSYENTVFRVIQDSFGYSIKPAYTLDFQEHWISQELLESSYSDRGRFFTTAGDYVHTVDIFETDNLIYVHYRLKNRDYTFIHDKVSGKQLDISGFSGNDIGWIGMPVTTDRNRIVNLVTPFDIAEAGIDPGEDLKVILENTSDEGSPILVFAKFQVR